MRGVPSRPGTRASNDRFGRIADGARASSSRGSTPLTKEAVVVVAAILLAALLVWLSTSSHTPTDAAAALVGLWEGEHAGQGVSLRLHAGGRSELRLTDLASGDTTVYKGRYVLDPSKQPIPLSFRNVGRVPHPLHTIVEFADPGTLRMAAFAPRWRLRPIAFDSEHTMTLRRRSEEPTAPAGRPGA